MWPGSNRQLRRRLKKKESCARHRRARLLEGRRWVVCRYGIAQLDPGRVRAEERPRGMKRAALLGIVHDDDAAWPQKSGSHQEVEQSEFVVMVPVDQDHVERALLAFQLEEKIHGRQWIETRDLAQLGGPGGDDL